MGITEHKYALADLSAVDSRLYPTIKSVVIPCRKKCTRGLCE